MKLIILIILLFLIAYIRTAKAQSEHIQTKWVKEDSIFIEKITNAYKTNPLSIEYLLSYKANRRENLGFGYYDVSGSTGKGYVSLFYEFIYFHTQLVSFRIEPQIPHDSRLTNRYLKWYVRLFTISQYKTPDALYYGCKEMSEPLSHSPGVILRDKQIVFYMTPYSGTMYGNEGGWGSTVDNRKNYRTVERKITPPICELFLYSKNPATRLTGVEFYYQHREMFVQNKGRIEKRIEVIFDELPQIETMAADLVITDSARAVVRRFAGKKL